MHSAFAFVLLVNLGVANAEPLTAEYNAKPPQMIGDAQLDVLQKLIDVTPTTAPERPDLLFRQAQQYHENMRFYAARAATRTDLLERDDDLRKRRQWLLASAKRLLDVADNHAFVDYARIDLVLVELIQDLCAVKKEDAARKYFKRL